MKTIVIVLAMIVIDIFLYFYLVGMTGFWPLLAITIATLIIGLMLFRTQSRKSDDRIMEAISSDQRDGKVPTVLLDGARLMVAGILLAIPGLLTDLYGVLLLVPGINLIAFRAIGMGEQEGVGFSVDNSGNASLTLDVDSTEVVDRKKSRKSRKRSRKR